MVLLIGTIHKLMKMRKLIVILAMGALIACSSTRGSNATMHHSTLYRGGKPYKLEVLYDKQTNSIWHFKYK